MYGDCYCCETNASMYVGVYVWTCARRIVTVIAPKGYACMCQRVCLGLCKAHDQSDCCEEMHVCMGLCIWACTRRMVTVIAAWRCISAPLRVCMHKAHAHCGCCEGMHACACLCVPVHKLLLLRGNACVWLFVCCCAPGAWSL